MMKNKIVVAYSGGLDTSVMVKWLSNKYDADIIAVTGNLGQKDNWDELREKALSTGASELYIYDVRKEFIEEYAWKALKSNALYEGEYPLATAIGRPLLVKLLVETAKKEGTNVIAHGCTGKGNDQVRFEVGIKTLMPDAKILAPLREWEFKTREEEIEYALKHNIKINITKKSPYSIDENLWGSATECGELENPENSPPEDAFQITTNPANAPDNPIDIELYFKEGVPTAINGVDYSPVEIVSILNKIGGDNGIGRIDMIENRVIGIKSREVYEAPGAIILHYAHKQLEKLTLDKDTYRYKEELSLKISNLIYDGFWFSPLFESLMAFVDSTQKYVTGKIKLRLFKGTITTLARSSEFSLYNEALATYSKGDQFNHQAAKGFIELNALPYSTLASIRNNTEVLNAVE
ncbi:MAG: argininosuccinate synthase [Ignavibacteria bacterium]|nr:MAG: argininosuccinate synthase [Ignavibacteria bacterium]